MRLTTKSKTIKGILPLRTSSKPFLVDSEGLKYSEIGLNRFRTLILGLSESKRLFLLHAQILLYVAR